jgi:hypothetical protein
MTVSMNARLHAAFSRGKRLLASPAGLPPAPVEPPPLRWVLPYVRFNKLGKFRSRGQNVLIPVARIVNSKRRGNNKPVVIRRITHRKQGDDRRSGTHAEDHRPLEGGHLPPEKIDPQIMGRGILVDLEKQDAVAL